MSRVHSKNGISNREDLYGSGNGLGNGLLGKTTKKQVKLLINRWDSP